MKQEYQQYRTIRWWLSDWTIELSQWWWFALIVCIMKPSAVALVRNPQEKKKIEDPQEKSSLIHPDSIPRYGSLSSNQTEDALLRRGARRFANKRLRVARWEKAFVEEIQKNRMLDFILGFIYLFFCRTKNDSSDSCACESCILTWFLKLLNTDNLNLAKDARGGDDDEAYVEAFECSWVKGVFGEFWAISDLDTANALRSNPL